MKKSDWLKISFFSLLSLFFLFVPIYSAFYKGVFRWHLSQPILWKDVVELLLYVVAMIILSKIAKKKKGFVVLMIGTVYLLSTGTFSQCLVSYLYIEAISFIGKSFLAVFSKEKTDYSTGVNFLAGSICYGTIAIIMSLLNKGTINDLRILVFVLLFLAVINPKNQMSSDRFLVVKYVKYVNEIEGIEFFLCIAFVVVMLISCARVNTFFESDSSWYALYTDKCLFGENSFYDYLGYSAFVHYYPKFKELLMAPISGLGLEGYLISSNIWLMVICMIEVYKYLIEKKIRRIHTVSVVYLVFSSACIVGISSTAKSDTISYLFMILLIFYFCRFLEQREWKMFYISVVAGIMSYTVKYTSFLFSTLIFCVMFFITIGLLWRKKVKWEKPEILSSVLIVMACFVFVGIIYRTWKLTGYPTYKEGMGIWNALGCNAKPYFGVDIKLEKVFKPNRILCVLFDVGNAEKITAQWIGNYTVFFGICLCFLYTKKQQINNCFLFILTIILDLVSVYFLVTMALPDGNYFAIAIIVTTCYFLIRIENSKNWEKFKRWFMVMVSLFIIVNIMFVFVTHPSWGTATRFSNAPIVAYVSEEDKFSAKKELEKSLGLYEISENLNSTNGDLLILSDGGTNMCMLNGRIEQSKLAFDNYLSGTDVHSYEDFLKYIDYVGVDGFIVANDAGRGYEKFDIWVSQYLKDYGYIEQVDTELYRYYKIR